MLEEPAGVALCGSIGDAALRDPAERGGGCHVGRRSRPPHHHRGVRQEEPGDESLLVLVHVSIGLEHDDLTRARVPADADLRVEAGVVPVVGVVGRGRDDDDPHRMFTGGVVRRLDRVLLVAEGRRDDEGQHAAEGHGATLLADAHERLRDAARGRVGQVDDHGRLQVRPSRASSSSADEGPHVPGR